MKCSFDDVKIVSYSKRQFDKMVKLKEYSENDSFISIGYTFHVDKEFLDDDPVHPLSGRFLRILFDDIVSDFGQCVTMRKHQALEMLEFLKDHAGGTIHVHCQVGQSRSVAVAESIAQHYRAQHVAVDLTHTSSMVNPNLTVLRIFAEILQNGTSGLSL